MACLMKFNMKFKFQGPPSFPLHHLTAFDESDQKIIGEELISGEEIEILTAQKIAQTCAELISNGGMGHANKQMKNAASLRRTPPMTLRLQIGSRDALVFHFKENFDGQLHIVC